MKLDQKKSRLKILIVVIIIAFQRSPPTVVYAQNNSISGCIQQNLNQQCLQCGVGFGLVNNICVYNSCLSGMYYQEDANSSNNSIKGRCVAICDSGFIQNDKTNLCVQLQECSLEYKSEMIFSQATNFLGLYCLNDDIVTIQQNNSILQIQRQDGVFVNEIILPDVYIATYQFNDKIIAIKQDYGVYKWDLMHNTFTYLLTILISGPKDWVPYLINIDNSQLITYMVVQNKNYIIFQQLLAYDLTPINSSLFYYQLPQNISVQLFNSIIVISDPNQGIRIDEMYISLDSSLQIRYFTNKNYLCTLGQSIVVNEIIPNSNKSKYALILENNSNIFFLDNANCNSSDLSLISQDIVHFILESQDYYLLSFKQSIKVISDQIVTLQIINFSPENIIQILLVQNLSKLLLFTLLNNNQILQFIITYQNGQLVFNQQNQHQIIMTTPFLLYYLPSVPNSQISDRLFILGDKIESFIVSNINSQITEKQSYLVSNYQFQYDKINSSIIQYLILEDINLLVTCSTEGVFVWDDQHLFNSFFLFSQSSAEIQDYCHSLFYLNNYDILIVYMTKIIVMELYNFTIKQSWSINSLSPNFIPQVSLQGSSCLLIFNQSLFIYSVDTEIFTQFSFNQYSDQINWITYQFNNILIAQRNQSIFSYSLDLTQKTVTQIQSYVASSQIIKIKVRTYTSNIFEINFYLSTRVFIILDSSLNQVISVQNIPLASLSDFTFLQSDPTDTAYYLLGQSSTPQQFPAILFYIDKSNAKLIQAGSSSSGIILLEPQKLVDSFGQTFYNVPVIYHQSTFSIIGSYYYYPSIQLVFYGNIFFQYGNINGIYQTTNDSNDIIMSDSSGFIGVNEYNINFSSVLYSLSAAQSNSNPIMNTIHNVQMNKIFVIRKNSIVVFNIFTSAFEEEYVFGNVNDKLVDYEIIQNLSLIIVCKSNILAIRNFLANTSQTYSDTLINGLVFESNLKYIITFGVSITILDLNLTVIQQINYNKGNIATCDSDQSIVFCLTSTSQQTLLITSLVDFTNQILVSPRNSMMSFKLLVDKTNKRLLLFGQVVELYTYNGQLFQQIGNISQLITEVIISSRYLILLQSSSSKSIVNIQDISTFQLVYSITILDGDIATALFVEQYNHLLVAVNNIQIAQVYAYDLIKQVLYVSIKNSFSPNNVSKVVRMVYDNDFNQLTFLDQTGNLFSIYYVNLQSLWSLTKYLEFDNAINPMAKGLSIDFTYNNWFVYSDQIVMQINYSQLTTRFKEYQFTKNNFYCKIEYNYQQSTNTLYLINGQGNTIYLYQNNTIMFQGIIQSTQQIKDIQYFNSMVIISFSSSFQVYDVTSILQNPNIQISSLTFQTENSFSINRFLAPNIFLTNDNRIFHYNYMTMQVITQINLSSRLSHFQFDSTSQLLVIGDNNGNVIVYNSLTFKIFTYSLNLQSNSLLNAIKYIDQTDLSLWIGSLNGQIVCFDKSSQSFGVLINVNSILNQNTEIVMMKIDEKNNRIFVSYLHIKLIYCMNYSSLSQLQNSLLYLSFPGSGYKKIKITSTKIILYSQYQLNIHDRLSLQYLVQIRRENCQDVISSFEIFQEQFYLIVSQFKFELFYVDYSNSQVQLVDQVIVTNIQIIDLIYSNTTNSLRFIGSLSNQIIDEIYYFQYYINQIQLSQYGCSSTLVGLSYYDMQKQINLIKPLVQQQPTMLGIELLLGTNQTNLITTEINNQDFSEISFSAIGDSQLVISSITGKSLLIDEYQILQVNQSSFFNYPKEQIFLQQFNLQLSNEILSFNNITSDIYLQDIGILNQTFSNIQIIIKDIDNLVINNLIIENVDISRTTQTGLSFFSFVNCSTISIQNMIIKNVSLLGDADSSFFSISQINNLAISNLQVINSQFNTFLEIKEIQNSQFLNLTIQDCVQSESINNATNIFLYSEGVQNTNIQYLNFLNNQNLLFLYYNNTYQSLENQVQLTNDSVFIQDSSFTSNFAKQEDHTLLSVSTTNIKFNNVSYTKNNVNIYLFNIQNIVITNSSFLLNQGINGGSIFIEKNIASLIITNTIFKSNIAQASGGAFYLKQQSGKISIDETTQIIDNIAMIGGGFRIYNNQQYSYLDQLYQIIKNKNIDFNFATLFGNNYSFDQQVVKVISVFSNLKSDNQQIAFDYYPSQFLNTTEQQSYSGKLILYGIKSGDSLNISVAIEDEEQHLLLMSSTTFGSKQYPPQIQLELSQYYFQIESLNQELIYTVGQTLVEPDSYNTENNSFVFADISVFGKPNSEDYLVMHYSINEQKRKPILIEVQFRNCIRGEIYKQQYLNIYSCSTCQQDTYSLQVYDNTSFSQVINNNQLFQICSKCPSSASSCQGDAITLQDGYWRSSPYSDQISYCENNPLNCQESSSLSINGCVLGAIGPLCEQCDSFGRSWNKTYTTTFISKYKCTECNSFYFQLLFLLGVILCVTAYTLISTVLFMNGFFYTQKCYYLRQLKLLPISRSSIKDLSSYYLKILINYLQVTSYLIKFEGNQLQQYISQSIGAFQSPSYQVTSSLDCLVNLTVKTRIQRIQATLIFQLIIPITLVGINNQALKLFKLFKVYEVKQYHFYTMLTFLFVYFQPNQITLFIQSLVCRRIGNTEYTELDATIQCNDTEYQSFVYPFTIVVLSIYLLVPFYILMKLKQVKENLHECIVRYKYGFFYSEYKDEFYYWEFIRINNRVLILIAYTLLSGYPNLAYIIISFFISTYTLFLLYLKPYKNKKLQSAEMLSSLSINFNLIFQSFNNYYDNAVTQTIFYLFYLISVSYLFILIVSQKMQSRFNFLGKGLRVILKYFLPIKYYLIFVNQNQTHFHIYKKWKYLRQNLKLIIVQSTGQIFNKPSYAKNRQMIMSPQNEKSNSKLILKYGDQTYFMNNSQIQFKNEISQNVQQPTTPLQQSFSLSNKQNNKVKFMLQASENSLMSTNQYESSILQKNSIIKTNEFQLIEQLKSKHGISNEADENKSPSVDKTLNMENSSIYLGKNNLSSS